MHGCAFLYRDLTYHNACHKNFHGDMPTFVGMAFGTEHARLSSFETFGSRQYSPPPLPQHACVFLPCSMLEWDVVGRQKGILEGDRKQNF